MADKVQYEKVVFGAGDVLKASHINRYETYFEDIYGILYAQPEILDCPDVMYTSYLTEAKLNFNIKARGAVNVTIWEGSEIKYNEKTELRSFNISMGTITTLEPNHRYYTIQISDIYGNSVKKTVTNIIINASLGFVKDDVFTQSLEDLIIPYTGTSTNIASKLFPINFTMRGGEAPLEGSFELEYAFNDAKEYTSFYGDTTISNNGYVYIVDPRNNSIMLNNIEAENDYGLIRFRAKYALGTMDNVIETNDLIAYYYLVEEGTYKLKILNNLNVFTSNEHFVVSYKILDPTKTTGEVVGDISANMFSSGEEDITVTRNNYRVRNNVVSEFNFNLLKPRTYDLTFYLDGNEIAGSKIEEIIVDSGAAYAEGPLVYLNALQYNSGEDCWKGTASDLIPNSGLTLSGKYAYLEPINIEATATTPAVREPAAIELNINAIGNIEKMTEIRNAINEAKEFSFELYYKSSNTGEYSSPVFTTASVFSDDKADYRCTVYNNRVEVYSSFINQLITYPLPEETWNHIVITYNKENVSSQKENENGTTETKQEISIQDKDYYDELKVYLNGCIIACAGGNGNTVSLDGFYDSIKPEEQRITLNGFVTNDFAQPENSSRVAYNAIRLYNKGLRASDVMLNYKNCIEHNVELLEQVKQLEANTTITQVFFIKNATPIKNDSKIKTYMAFDGNETTLGLHDIWKKEPDGDSEYKAGYSKTSAVNCTTYIIQRSADITMAGTLTQYNNMDVKLQGTSSLLYPGKNYQIKNYKSNEATKKQKFLPKVQEVNPNGLGWGGPEGDSVYTLKCDFMEQSHRNNTPTAKYYDEVLEAVVGQCSADGGDAQAYSPARNYANGYYRDSINGFPVIVYYSDNEEGLGRLDLETEDILTDEQLISHINTLMQTYNCKQAGSYMFNVDKEGVALGFELDDPSEETIKNDYPVEDQYITNYEVIEGTNQIKFVLDRNISVPKCVTVTDASEQEKLEWQLKTLESLEEIKQYTFALYYYGKSGENDNYYDIHKGDNCNIIEVDFENQTITCELEDTTIANIQNKAIVPLCVSYIIEAEKPISGYCVSFEGTTNTAEWAACNFYTVNESNARHNRDKLKYKFYADTLEPRYSYKEDERDEIKTYLSGSACEYERLDDLIKFLYLIQKTSNTSDFSAEQAMQRFETLFSKEYALTYYLQMLAFTQVDNSGKNAMFDVWDNGKIYPRPYDMDTQMGFDNVGYDRIPASAELITMEKAGGVPDFNLEYVGSGTGDENLDINVGRLESYNTLNSRLWNFVWQIYSDKLRTYYSEFRLPGGVYDPNVICEFINNCTSNIISITQYNIDAVLKYLSYKTQEFFYIVAGNRVERYKEFLKTRLNFLDSALELSEYSQKKFTLRVSAPDEIVLYLDVIEPTYLGLTAGQNSSETKFYLDPSMKYKYVLDAETGESEERTGAIIKFKNRTASGQETIFSNVGKIKSITGLGNANPGYIEGIVNMQNLQKFEMNQATGAIKSLSFDNPKLLELSINNLISLNEMNVSKTPNLKKLSLRGCTALGNLALDDPSSNERPEKPLTMLDLTDCSGLKSISLINCTNLSSVNLLLQGCTNLETLVIDNCPRLMDLNFSKLTKLKSLTITNCKNLENFDCSRHPSLTSLTIGNCENLKEIQLASSKLQALDLSNGLTKLEILNLSNSVDLETLKIPTNHYTTINLENCVLLAQVNSDENGTYDFEGISVGSLKVEGVSEEVPGLLRFGTTRTADFNKVVKKIINVNYCGTGLRFCQNLSALTTLSGNFVFTDSMDSAFYNCKSLSNWPGVYDGFGELITPAMHMGESKIKDFRNAFLFAPKVPARLKEHVVEKMFKDNETITDVRNVFRGTINSTEGYSQPWEAWQLKVPLPSSIKELNGSFVNSGLSNIKAGIFDNCTNLKSIVAAFSGNNLLTSIPDALFIKCPITDARFAFRSTGIVDLPRASIFKSEQQVDGSFLFANCENLRSQTPDNANEETNLFRFLEYNKYFTKLDCAFSGTKITNLNGAAGGEVGILAKNLDLYLISAIGIFSNCQSLETLPKCLYLNNRPDSSSTNSIDFSGIFYNCTKLTGTIPIGLFDGIRHRISSLGSALVCDSFEDDTKDKCLLGAFANTAITDYDTGNEADGYSPFANMTKLTNISALFAQVKLIKNTSPLTFTLQEPTDAEGNLIDCKHFKGYKNSSPAALAATTFKGCSRLSDVRAAFMGTGIERIDFQLNDQRELREIFSLGNNIKDLSCVFANTSLQDSELKYKTIDETTMEEVEVNTTTLGYFMKQICNTVETMDYTFTKTGINDANIIKPLTKLKSANGIFSGCVNITGISEDLFQNFKNSIKSLNYAFAKTNIATLEDSTIESYMIKDCYFVIRGEQGAEMRIYIGDRDSESPYLKLGDNAIKNIKENSDREMVITFEDDTQITNNYVDVIAILEFNEDINIPDKEYYDFYGGSRYNLNEDLYITSMTKDDIEIVNNSWQIFVGSKGNFQEVNLYNYKQIIPSKDSSLLHGCHNLESLSGMFYANEALEKIPGSLFTTNYTGRYSKLTHINNMFANCTNAEGYNASQQTLIPDNWLKACPAITQISGLFANLGSTLPEEKIKTNQYKLGETFNTITTFANADYAFANIPILQNTELTTTFMASSVRNGLRSCNYLFANTPISRYLSVFEKTDSSRNAIINFSHAFAYAFDKIAEKDRAEKCIITKKGAFASSVVFDQCWLSTTAITEAMASEKGWKSYYGSSCNLPSNGKHENYKNSINKKITSYCNEAEKQSSVSYVLF